MAVSTLIIEDEPVIAQRLSRMVRQAFSPDDPDVALTHTLDDARRALTTRIHDFAFLDINLMGADGFELLRACLLDARSTIVVSANTDRAIDAFELGVSDFVPKPFDQTRLELAISRAQAARDVRNAARYLAVQGRGVIEPVPISSIQRVQAAGNYAELILSDGSQRLYEATMDRLEEILPNRFVRIHRSHMVDLSLIARLESHSGSRTEAVLEDGARLPVGRTRAEKVKQALVGG